MRVQAVAAPSRVRTSPNSWLRFLANFIALKDPPSISPRVLVLPDLSAWYANPKSIDQLTRCVLESEDPLRDLHQTAVLAVAGNQGAAGLVCNDAAAAL